MGLREDREKGKERLGEKRSEDAVNRGDDKPTTISHFKHQEFLQVSSRVSQLVIRVAGTPTRVAKYLCSHCSLMASSPGAVCLGRKQKVHSRSFVSLSAVFFLSSKRNARLMNIIWYLSVSFSLPNV